MRFLSQLYELSWYDLHYLMFRLPNYLRELLPGRYGSQCTQHNGTLVWLQVARACGLHIQVGVAAVVDEACNTPYCAGINHVTADIVSRH